jgi:recombination protein RecA
LDELAGRLVEVRNGAAGAALTCAFGWLLQGQERGEPVAYIGSSESSFYPPDAVMSGLDLDALAVIRTKDPVARMRAADELVRSGAFAIVVVDLVRDDGERTQRIPPALVSRLLGLAKKHATAIVFLSPAEVGREEETSALGSLISLRAVVQRKALDETRQVVTVEAVKDKSGAPGWEHASVSRWVRQSERERDRSQVTGHRSQATGHDRSASLRSRTLVLVPGGLDESASHRAKQGSDIACCL